MLIIYHLYNFFTSQLNREVKILNNLVQVLLGFKVTTKIMKMYDAPIWRIQKAE